MVIRYVISTRDDETQETALEVLHNEIEHNGAQWTIEAGEHIDVIMDGFEEFRRLNSLLGDNLNPDEYQGTLAAR